MVTTFADRQAAIAIIENVRLFEAEKTLAGFVQANRDLAEREAEIRRLVDANMSRHFLFGIWKVG